MKEIFGDFFFPSCGGAERGASGGAMVWSGAEKMEHKRSSERVEVFAFIMLPAVSHSVSQLRTINSLISLFYEWPGDLNH